MIAVTDLLRMAIIQVFNGAGIDVPHHIAVMAATKLGRVGGTIPLTSVRMRGIDMAPRHIDCCSRRSRPPARASSTSTAR